jgi:hypothetical protein
MLTLTAPPSGPFDINALLPDHIEGARLPTPNPEYAVHVLNTRTYLDALHASIGDVARHMEGALTEVVKSLGVPPQAYSYATMSFMPDPANAGLLPWPGIAPESLQKIRRENIVPQLVIRSRVADLARYSGLSNQIWEPGWEIGLRDRDETPTEQDRKDIRDAQRFVWNCNRESSYSDARERDAHNLHPLDIFLRTFVDDTFTYDGWAVWTDMTRLGNVKAFANLPAGNIRLAIPGKGYANDPRYFCAMVDDTGNPVRPFTRDELFFAIRNPRTDPSAWGYGFTELEIGVRMIQAFQSGIDLNADSFTRNSIPNGMLLLKGDFWNQTQIDALMREWTNMKRGQSKVWGLPVMSVPEKGDVDVLDFMDMKGQDLRYKDHMNLMGGLYMAISQFPARRLGLFVSGNHKDNAPLPNESTETAGVDDPGLPPLLGFVASRMNDYLIAPNWPRLRLWFNGASPKQDAREYEARKLARTWRESRTAVDQPALTKGVSKKYKTLMELMELCPEDPAKAGVYQTLATKQLELMHAAETGGTEGGSAKDTDKVGAPFPSKTDPAESQAHGHRSGVRRDSASEAASAEASV